MKKIALFLGTLFAPVVAFAQNPGYINNWVTIAKDWLSTALVVIMALMTLLFLWRIFEYIREKDAGKLAEHRKKIFNGLIGLFIAISVWGIIRIAGNVFGTNGTGAGNFVPTCPPGMTYYPAPINQCR